MGDPDLDLTRRTFDMSVDLDETNVNVAPFPHELADVVEKLTYRPGWRFGLAPINRGQASSGLTFQVISKTYDSYNPERGETYQVQHYFPVPAAAYNRQSWMRWVLDRLIEIDTHECCEFFVVDGERPFAPIHAPGWDPYVVREQTDPEAVRTTFRGDRHDEVHELAEKGAQRLYATAGWRGSRQEARDLLEEILRGD